MSGKAAATSGEGLSGPTPSSKVDEAHWANNLPFATRLERVKGLPNPAECQCATDVFLKTQWLLERGGGIVFATGTPIANTIAESWTTARYLMLPTPEELGLHHFDAWAKLLGHVTAEMSLRYGRLFDATVRADYERALVLTKGGLVRSSHLRRRWKRIGTGRKLPVIKARLAGGYCLRTPAQGACPYANICEHCPNFRFERTFWPILATQRADTEALAADAEARGWGDEAARHHRLIERLDRLMAQDQAS
jgi:hypothetical protein